MFIRGKISFALKSLLVLFSSTILFANVGCQSYHFGAQALYPQDIRTVYVPMIESESFRRNMGERLTEAVAKEIEAKTNYKVVHYPNADTTLRIRLLNDRKNIITTTITDEPRELELTLKLKASWTRQNGSVIAQSPALAFEPNLVNLTAATQARVEVGDSIATSHQKAIQRLARQIVEMMESPW